MLFQSLDKIKRSVLMSTVVLMFIGAVLLMLPEGYFSFLNFLTGFALSIVLALSVFSFIGERKTLMSYIKLTLGLLAGAWALAFFLFEGLLLSLLSWAVGVLPILLGVYGVCHAILFARRSGLKAWWILIVLSALLVVFGGFIFWNPWTDSTEAFVKIVGGTLLYSAGVSAVRLIWIWPIRTADGEEAIR